MKKTLLGLFMAIVAMVAFNSCSGSDNPGAAAVKVQELLVQQKYDDFAKCLCDKEGKALDEEKQKSVVGLMQMVMSMKGADSAASAMPEAFEVKSEKVSEDGKTADVVLVEKYKDGKTKDSTIKMHNVEGKWMMEFSK